MPLFALNDSFIDSMCMGMTDDHAKTELVEALEAGRVEFEESVQRSLQSSPWKDRAEEFSVKLQNGSYVVIAPADIEADVLASEYGDDQNAPRPVLRQAIVRRRTAATSVINKKLLLR